MSSGDLFGGAVLSAIFLGLVAVAEVWKRFGNAHPEHSRKLVHLGGGIACLLFPFLVRSPWVVLVMASAMTALFAFGGRWGFLQSLHGIDRPSHGAEFYPLAVFLVFLMARDQPAFYLSAILVLAIGDAFAALVGGHYGRIRYEVEDEQKSLEGSLVFLVIAFLAIHLPLLLMTDLDRTICVLAALLVAVLVTGFEAISLEGADNLYVPLAVVVILGKITTKPLSEVIHQNLSLAVICGAVALIVWRLRSFNVGGTLTFILFAYGTWSLGSWQWALPVFAGFLAFVVGWFISRPDRQRELRVRTIARALLLPFLVLALANGTGVYRPLFGPYVAALGTVLALALPTGLLGFHQLRGLRWLGALGAVGVCGWLGTALVPWLLQQPAGTPLTGFSALAAAGAVVLALTLVNGALDRRHPEAALSREWTARRFLITLAAPPLVWGLQNLGWISLWNP